MTEQDWTNIGGAEAFQLIERHAEDWADAGRMMEAWREAQTARLNAEWVAERDRMTNSHAEWMAKCEELRKDAERYRKFVEIRDHYIWAECSPEDVARILDAALAKKEGA